MSLQFSALARVKADYNKQSIVQDDLSAPPGTVRTMFEGAYFGEISPLLNCKRSATVIARNYGTYGALNKEAL